jgi:hypothetical protein
MLYASAIDMIYGKSEQSQPLFIIKLHVTPPVVVVNSLLATLNSRLALKGEGVRGDPPTTDDTTTSIPMTTLIRTVLAGMHAVSDYVFHLLNILLIVHLIVHDNAQTDQDYHGELR